MIQNIVDLTVSWRVVCDDIVVIPKHMIDPNNLSELQQLEYVRKNPYGIIDIIKPSLQVQLAAVDANGYAISCIKNPHRIAQIAALEQDGRLIVFLPRPDLELKLIAWANIK